MGVHIGKDTQIGSTGQAETAAAHLVDASRGSDAPPPGSQLDNYVMADADASAMKQKLERFAFKWNRLMNTFSFIYSSCWWPDSLRIFACNDVPCS